MSSHGLKRGTYATTSRFTADALAFAHANGINAPRMAMGCWRLSLLARPSNRPHCWQRRSKEKMGENGVRSTF